ncbi:MAG TPA: PEP/pyruvate-binding domain-containing protein, partial [Pseudonocardiaceae bacterium]
MTTTPSTTGTVLPLAAATDHRIAGRKAATLARLAAAGFPVPPGVVLAADVLEESVGTAFDVPAGVVADLVSMVRSWGDVPLAVRSSGVDEDGADASFAGLFTTVLDVRGDAALLAAVRTCWRSAFDARVAAYSGDRRPRLAVLVQPMVAATAAGVAFTADPVTGARDRVVIDAVPGLGDRLASGEVTPARWVIGDDGAILRRAQEPGRAAAIDDARARAVATLARRVAAQLGGPQDVEWALAGEDVILLQARPVTALPARPVPVPVDVPAGFWTREASHSPLPWWPFTASVMELRNPSFRRMAAELGLLFDGLDIRPIGGWEYIRIVPLGDKQPPPLPEWLVPVAFRLVPALRRRIRESVAAARSDVAGRLVQRWWHEWQPDFDARIRALRDRGLSGLSDGELVAHLQTVLELASDSVDVHFRLNGALGMVLGEFAFTCRDALGWDETRTFSLLCGT